MFEVILILQPPRSSYKTSKNFSKCGLQRVHFPKIFLNNYSIKHLEKNLLLNQGFSMKRKKGIRY